MRLLTLILTMFLILPGTAHATSRSDSGGNRLTAPYCEVLARFDHPTHQVEAISYKGTTQREARVAWIFNIESASGVAGGTCPSGASFDLSIRGADVVVDADGTQQYVYPVYVEALESNARALLRIREVAVRDPRTNRQFKEWIVINWTQGIEKK